jgi:hypothetical protein
LIVIATKRRPRPRSRRGFAVECPNAPPSEQTASGRRWRALEKPMPFYELRQYQILPGKMAEWIEFMEKEIIPFQVSKGMVITGSFRHETDESIYVWTRRFENEQQRVELYAAVYESSHWKDDIAPRVSGLIDRSAIQVLRIVPTPKSPVQ